MFGVTPQGFNRKTYEDILGSMEANARNLFGNDIDLSETSPLGQKLRIVAYELAEKWKALEDTYNSAYVDTSEGLQLRRVGKHIGITERALVKAKTNLLISGDVGKLVFVGFRGATSAGIEFETLTDVTIEAGGSVLAPVKAVLAGSIGNVAANTITVIVNPTAGIASITNPDPATGGQAEEVDMEFRDRYSKSVAKGGSSTTDSIRAKLLDEVPGVRDADVFENDTDIVDESGRPPKSLECIVLGGNDEDIAKAILDSKAGGIQAYGTTTIIVQDKSGKNKSIGFTRATEKLIYVNINITKDAAYPADGDDQVKLLIIKYIGGTDSNGNNYAGLTMGEKVVYNALIGEVYKIPGVKELQLEIGTDGLTYSNADIPIGGIEAAETNNDIVVVTSHV